MNNDKPTIITLRQTVMAMQKSEEELKKIKKYQDEVNKKIDEEINKKLDFINDMRQSLSNFIETDTDFVIENKKSGAKKVMLPDLATVSLSSPKKKISILDKDRVMKKLGKDYFETVNKLKTREAKQALLKLDEKELEGIAEVKTEQSLRVLYK